MLEPKDLENLQKICKDIEKLGFTKPRITISDAERADARIEIIFRKNAFQVEKDNT